jgi:hypothetical protein
VGPSLEASPKPRKRSRPQPRPDALAYTVSEARELGGPARTKLYALLNSNELKSRLVGKRRLIDGESLRALLRSDS